MYSTYLRTYKHEILNYDGCLFPPATPSSYFSLSSYRSYSPTKLICFTRSSQLVHQLPTHHPTSSHRLPSEADDGLEQVVKEMVFSDPTCVVVYKLSTVTTFTLVNELLRSFASSESQQVMLFVLNMQEASTKLVNHLRIMIEEVESLALSNACSKVYAMLLHFPASHLSSPCYPSLFLEGWDLHYLDVIGCGPTAGVLDIRDWFKQCYISQAITSFSEDDAVIQQLHSLLREAIPVAATKIYTGNTKSSLFDVPMGLPEKKLFLEELLFEKGVGDVLCGRFLSYWQPSVMVQYLEKAAIFSGQHETTVNLIDSLHTIFRDLFVDFIVHMVLQISTNNNSDILFNPNCSPSTKSLFLALLQIHPVPKLSELRMLRIVGDTSSLDESKDIVSSPRFPFFMLVSMAIDRLVEQSHREINEEVDMLSEHRSPPLTSVFDNPPKTQTMASMVAAVENKLNEIYKV